MFLQGKVRIFSHLREQLSGNRLALVSATIDVFVDGPDLGFLPLDHYHLVAIIINENLSDLGGGGEKQKKVLEKFGKGRVEVKC